MRGCLLAVLGACQFSANSSPADVDAGADPGADAAAVPPDAAFVFDPARCPAGYASIGPLPHRYRGGLVPNTSIVGWRAAQARCAQDQLAGGYTAHLVVFETAAERDAVWAVIGPTYNFLWSWTGVYRRSDGEWASILGGTVAPNWAPNEPRARNGAAQHGICVGAVGSDYGDLDLPFDWNEQIICECDGRSVISLP